MTCFLNSTPAFSGRCALGSGFPRSAQRLRTLPCFINSAKTNNRSTHKATHDLSAAGRFALLQELSANPTQTSQWIRGDNFTVLRFNEPLDATPISTSARDWTPCFFLFSLPFFALPSLICLDLPRPRLGIGPNSCITRKKVS